MPDPSSGRAAALPLLVAVTMTGTVALHIFVPALAAVAADLGATAAATQLTMTLYLARLAAGQLVYGPLSDRFGRRRVLIGGLSLYLAGLLLAMARRRRDAGGGHPARGGPDRSRGVTANVR